MPLDLFVSPEDTFTVDFAVCAAKSNPKTILADISVEKLKEVYEDEVDEPTIEKHTATFRRPTFEDMSRLFDDAFSWDGTNVKAAASSVRLNKVIRLLKSWTLNKPPTAQEVRRLSPIIALVLTGELDRLTV